MTFEVKRTLRLSKDDTEEASGHHTAGGASVKPTWVQPHPEERLAYVALNGASQVVEVDLGRLEDYPPLSYSRGAVQLRHHPQRQDSDRYREVEPFDGFLGRRLRQGAGERTQYPADHSWRSGEPRRSIGLYLSRRTRRTAGDGRGLRSRDVRAARRHRRGQAGIGDRLLENGSVTDAQLEPFARFSARRASVSSSSITRRFGSIATA